PRPPLLALDNVSLSLRAGESMAVIGPAGAGKSTLARIIVGLDTATSGELKFGETPYRGADLPQAIRRDIAFVGDNPAQAFNPRHTVGESIAEPLQLELQRSLDELGSRIVEVVTAVGLHPDILARLPAEFALPDLQRLAIARALVTRPRLIVFDDPLLRLDVLARGEILVLLNRLRADFGLSFILIGHDLDLMRVAADRVTVLDRGRVVEAGTPARLLEDAQQPLSRRLVAAQLPDVGIVPVF
ncbi:MAG TPA: ATP-binding cassette domain-containing protein, partial [Devosia sp.]|nr:ATP-binding cassette domain-containing protein [Devosia sp.]